MEDLNLVVIYGSYRRERLGIRAAKFVVEQLRKRCNVEFIDAQKVGLPILDLRYYEYEKGSAPQNLEKAAISLRETDGIVIVTGEYNRSLPPGLSNFLDHFTSEYRNKPVGIVSYSDGSFGGVRAAEHLRTTVANLGMIALPQYFPIPLVKDAFDEEGRPLDEKAEPRFTRFLDKFIPFAQVMKDARVNGRFG